MSAWIYTDVTGQLSSQLSAETSGARSVTGPLMRLGISGTSGISGAQPSWEVCRLSILCICSSKVSVALSFLWSQIFLKKFLWRKGTKSLQSTDRCPSLWVSSVNHISRDIRFFLVRLSHNFFHLKPTFLRAVFSRCCPRCGILFVFCYVLQTQTRTAWLTQTKDPLPAPRQTKWEPSR